MRLLVIADSAIPVPPSGYGGTERILSYLINGLAERGHQITLMAARGSRSPGRLIVFSDARTSSRPIRGAAKGSFWIRLARELRHHDLVHSVARLDYLWPALRSNIPKVLQFQNPINKEQVTYVRRHARGQVVMAPVGFRMMTEVRDDGIWRPIHNAIPVERYRFSSSPASSQYLAFFGRLTPNKGAHTAIRIASKVGIKLIIGGNIGSAKGDKEYFDREIQPHIDGHNVEYIGELNDAQKTNLIGGAVALLNPIQWDEPFGIVTIEALACGTPVVAFKRGELPYLIRNGTSGFICSSEAEMVNALNNIGCISREACRREAIERFDVSRLVNEYDETYRWLLAGNSTAPESWTEYAV